MTATKAQQSDDPKVIDDRIDQFMDLGFSYEEARVLAASRNVDGNYWRANQVQRMLDHPQCNHALVLELLL